MKEKTPAQYFKTLISLLNEVHLIPFQNHRTGKSLKITLLIKTDYKMQHDSHRMSNAQKAPEIKYTFAPDQKFNHQWPYTKSAQNF